MEGWAESSSGALRCEVSGRGDALTGAGGEKRGLGVRTFSARIMERQTCLRELGTETCQRKSSSDGLLEQKQGRLCSRRVALRGLGRATHTEVQRY